MFIVDFNPHIIEIYGFAIRWYAVAYIVGFMLARYWMIRYVHIYGGLSIKHIDDFLLWAVIAVVIGGRIGFTLFWYPEYYIINPIEIIQIWKGGMAFHGGILGVIIAGIIFCKKHNINMLMFGDYLAISTPFGLFLGRIANFINGELWGRVTDVPWAVIFPKIDHHLRHPSPLYEAFLEGIMVFVIVMLTYKWQKKQNNKNHGLTMGVFLVAYAIARMIAEVFREEAYYEILPLTNGQLLSLPMLIIGSIIIVNYIKKLKK